MLSAKIKDIKIRNSFKKIEKIRQVKKFLFTNLLNQSLKKDVEKKDFVISFLKSKTNIALKSKVRTTNRCVINNRSRGTIRPYGISRILLRDLMQFGVLPGYSKAVW